ncbi:MAG: galactokinase [Acholeplasmatales bacterium]|nr:galactokinase [Acholeplasmatales bacterium]
MTNLENLFKQTFNTCAEATYRAPARINLIGEHIDYNGGFVLPACVSLYIYGLVSKRDDDRVILKSTAFSSPLEVFLSDLNYKESLDWGIYPIGVLYTLKKRGYNLDKGLNILFDSNIPLGSGLSSSAAILDLTAYIANDIYKLGLNRKELVLVVKEVENDYCGLHNGIMDEAIILLGKESNAMLLDCAKFEYEFFPMDLGKYRFVVLKTNKPRKLIESKYNERVEECNKGLDILKKKYNINHLCDLDSNNLNYIRELITDDIIYKRVKHVISENDRVKDFISAMKNNDISTLGRLLNESDKSLREDYEVTGSHLDAITRASLNANAIGARMTGAGFGGCAIALIKKDSFDTFKKNVINEYEKETGITPDVVMVDIVEAVNKL